MEGCPSGLRSSLGKRVWVSKPTAGSNPALSATLVIDLTTDPRRCKVEIAGSRARGRCEPGQAGNGAAISMQFSVPGEPGGRHLPAPRWSAAAA